MRLGTLGGPDSTAVAINGRGQIVGWSTTNAKDEYGSISHAFLWQNGKMRDLGTLGGKSSSANAINGSGQIVGESYTRGDVSHAFLWENGKMRDLGTLGGNFSTAVAINDRGQILGERETDDGKTHGVVWLKGRITDLDILPGRPFDPYPVAINEKGQVTGNSADRQGSHRNQPNYHAFKWESGRMSDLGILPGGQSNWAYAVNNLGQIVGASDKSDAWHAVLWTLRSGT